MHKGAFVPPFYDSMIAKLIVLGSDRAEALERLSDALAAFRIEGISTNLSLLRTIAAHPDFVANRIDTRWSERVLLPAHVSNTGT
jgi:acetyl-CoA carboxylase biotin carboxylase subunit